jgi:hypothetical protein
MGMRPLGVTMIARIYVAGPYTKGANKYRSDKGNSANCALRMAGQLIGK